jgi:hypothetical protein
MAARCRACFLGLVLHEGVSSVMPGMACCWAAAGLAIRRRAGQHRGIELVGLAGEIEDHFSNSGFPHPVLLPKFLICNR